MGCPRPVSLGPLLQLKLPAGSCHPRQGSGRPWYPPVGRRQEGALRWEGGSLFQAPSSELGAWLREDGYAPGTDSPSLGDRSWVTQSRGTQWPGPLFALWSSGPPTTLQEWAQSCSVACVGLSLPLASLHPVCVHFTPGCLGCPVCPPGSHSWWHWVASRSTLLDVEALRTRAMYY